jgi:hypothetical protein
MGVTPRPRFTPEERTPGTHWIGGWVGPRAGLEVGSRTKILCSCRGSNPDQTLYCLSYCGSGIYPDQREIKYRDFISIRSLIDYQLVSLIIYTVFKIK